MEKQRLVLGLVVLVAMAALAYFLVDKNTGETVVPEDTKEEQASLPKLEREKIDAVEIKRPDDEEAIVLTKKDDDWRVTSPIEAATDESAINGLLDKLAALEAVEVVAQNPEHHERLEVSEDKAVRVTVKGGGKQLLAILIGAYRGGNTMGRIPGKDEVLGLEGSIKYAFNKELKDWRDRAMVDVDAAKVTAMSFKSDNGEYAFVRGAEDKWEQKLPRKPIARYDEAKVQSVASSLARMRAVGFAEPEVDAEKAGLAEPAATVTLTPKEGEPIVIELGKEAKEREFYARVQNNDVIYIVTSYLADRMRPNDEQFQKPEEKADEKKPAGDDHGEG